MLLYLVLLSSFTSILADIHFTEAVLQHHSGLPTFLHNGDFKDIKPDFHMAEIVSASVTVPEEETKFPHFELMDSLRLVGGNLPVTKPGYFSNLPQLLTLSLEDFVIKKLKSGMFEGIPSVSSVFLQNDQIEDIEDGAFGSLKFLTAIDLSSNEIEKIRPEWFLNCDGVEKLDIRHNTIVEIQDGAFKYLKNLTKLDLYSNKIVSVGENAFMGLRSLSTLVLAGNQLEDIRDDLVRGVESLDKLNLSQNRLRCLSEKFLNSLRKSINVYFINNKQDEDCKGKLYIFTKTHPDINIQYLTEDQEYERCQKNMTVNIDCNLLQLRRYWWTHPDHSMFFG
ncbi:leucine rich repeat [Holotrichia oblita]|uniref:Leucine rich repeat n=1 Tax=Holotrichia oblita TaxID=644536 RepID=A0ACB9TY35_HOLOL|nr:leucine rich repeat [Holotrichia oblita]